MLYKTQSLEPVKEMLSKECRNLLILIRVNLILRLAVTKMVDPMDTRILYRGQWIWVGCFDFAD